MKKSTKTLTIAILMVLGLAGQTFAQLPVANFSLSSNPVCVNKTFTCTDMSTGTPTAWVWQSTGATPTLGITQNPVFSYSAAGVYTIGMLCANGTGTALIPAVQTITVLAGPNLTVTSSQSVAVCPGSTVVTLTAIGGTAYVWGAPLTSSATTATLTVPGANTTYSVVGTGTNGCTSTGTVLQNVTAKPLVVVSSSPTLCVNSSATLTASGGTAYLWAAPVSSTNAAIVISPTVAGNVNYTVTATSSVVCPGYAWITVFTQSISTCVGIQKVAGSNVSFGVYPNPTSGEFTIELNNGVAKTIEVMDFTGRIVLSNMSSDDKISMNLNSLAKGIYYVRVQSNNTIEVAKIVKQ